MGPRRRTKMTGMGVYIPETVLDNFYFENLIDTSDNWIRERTGIHERRIVSKDETCNEIAAKSVIRLQEDYNVDLKDVDFILGVTCTSDCIFPSMSSQIQNRFSIPSCGALDISAACAGFTYSLCLAKSLVESNMCKKILIVVSETLSKIVDYSDRNTCVLFGDGATSFIIEATSEENVESISFVNFGSDGFWGSSLYLSHTSDFLGNTSLNSNKKINQEGKKIFKWAVENVPKYVRKLLSDSNQTIEEIDWFIPHSANKRIINAIASELDFDLSKVLQSVELFGNTSSVSIPLALHLGVKDNRIKTGDKLLLYGFGGGMVHSGVIMNWTLD